MEDIRSPLLISNMPNSALKEHAATCSSDTIVPPVCWRGPDNTEWQWAPWNTRILSSNAKEHNRCEDGINFKEATRSSWSCKIKRGSIREQTRGAQMETKSFLKETLCKLRFPTKTWKNVSSFNNSMEIGIVTYLSLQNVIQTGWRRFHTQYIHVFLKCWLFSRRYVNGKPR